MIEVNEENIKLEELKNRNFPVKINGKEFWISRAVVVFVFKKVNDELCLLSEIRGDGAADFNGYRCVPCGYIDYNENLQQAAVRELKEETGFIADADRLIFMKINSNPQENRQNISVHFVYFCDENENFNLDNAIGGEPNEIERVEWIPIGIVEKNNIFKRTIMKRKRNRLNMFVNQSNEKWAFNHYNIMVKHLSNFYDIIK